MALIKEKTERRQTGNYWFIVRRGPERGAQDNYVVVLQCYPSKSARLEDKTAKLWYPTDMFVRFDFQDGDHPFTDLDGDSLNLDKIKNVTDIETHLIYLHILRVAQAALAVSPEQRTQNESVAVWLADAENDL